MACHPADPGRLEERGVVLPGRPEAAGSLGRVESQIELREARRHLDRGSDDPVQPERLARSVLEGEHRLEERVVDAALGAQLFDEPLERKVLVLECAERRLPDAAEELAEGGITGETAAQHEGVREESDEPLGLDRLPVRDRRSHEHVLLAGIPVEEGLEGREERHEERGPLAPPEEPQRRREVRAQDDGVRRAAPGGNGRARPVRRKIEDRRSLGELALPVAELGVETAAGELAPLPDGEVGIPDPERGQRGRRAAPERVVERGELPEDDRNRPPVGRDVVHRQDEHVRAGGLAQQERPEHGVAGQVERAAYLFVDPPPDLFRVGAGEVDDRARDRRRRIDDLHRLAVDRPIRRPERLVPRDDRVEGAGQRGDVEVPSEAKRFPDVVEPSRLELIEEPEPLLGERQRTRLRGPAGRDFGERNGGGPVAHVALPAAAAAGEAARPSARARARHSRSFSARTATRGSCVRAP